MRWASKTSSIEQFDPRIPLKKSTFSTGCADRTARSKKLGSKRHFFDCVKTHDLVLNQKSPFSIHRSDCIRIGRRPFIMRSDSGLPIFIFRSEKKMGLHMQSNEKSDGIKSDLRIRWPKLSDFGPKSDDSTHRILKSKMASVFNQVKI